MRDFTYRRRGQSLLYRAFLSDRRSLASNPVEKSCENGDRLVLRAGRRRAAFGLLPRVHASVPLCKRLHSSSGSQRRPLEAGTIANNQTFG